MDFIILSQFNKKVQSDHVIFGYFFIINRSPILYSMIHCKSSNQQKIKDPFKEHENEFSETLAIQSELFELESLKKLFYFY